MKARIASSIIDTTIWAYVDLVQGVHKWEKGWEKRDFDHGDQLSFVNLGGATINDNGLSGTLL